MRVAKFLTAFITTVIIIGCSSYEHPNNYDFKKNIDIDIKKKKEFNPKRQLCKIQMIPLQTTTECLIQDIDKLYLTDDYIIVFDQSNSNIFQFDKKGQYLRKIGVKGQGPLEYNTFNDVIYDPCSNKIFAFKRFNSMMYIYNLNGELERTIKSKFMFNSFIRGEQGFWIYSCFKQNNPNNCALMLVDEELTFCKKEYFPQADITTVHFTPRFTVNNDNGEQYFYYDGSDIIWKLSDKAEGVYKVDFGEYTLPYKEMKKSRSVKEYDNTVHRGKYLGFIDNLIVSNDFLTFKCKESGLNKPSIPFYIEYDLPRKSIGIYNSITMGDGIVPANYLEPLYLSKETFVYAIEPQKLSSHEFKALKKEYANASEDDNPILLFMKRR